MPAPKQQRAADGERQEFPGIAERIGHDPAKFLDRDLVERGPNHTWQTSKHLVLALIKGLPTIGKVNGWLKVEKQLDRGPREPIVELLETRLDYLIEHGERTISSRAEIERRRAARTVPIQEPEPEPVWRHVVCGTTDVDQESRHAWFCNTCEQRTNRVERVDEASEASADERSEASGASTADEQREVGDVDAEDESLTNAPA